MTNRRGLGGWPRAVSGLVPIGLVATGFLLSASASATAAHDATAVVTSYDATVKVDTDGGLLVDEVVVVDFGGAPTDSFARETTTREHYDETNDRDYDVGFSDVAADDVAIDDTVTEDGDVTRVTVDFDEPQSGTVTLHFAYTVRGATAETADGLEVRWPVVQGLDLDVTEATVTWNAPGALWVSCLAGALGSSKPCTATQLGDAPAPVMSQLGVAAGDQLVGILGLAADSGVAADVDLKARWSLSRSFSASGAPLGIALAVLLIGLAAAFGLWWSRGRDTDAGEVAAHDPLVDVGDGRVLLAPPGAVRPGQMGTLVDEHADVVDVTATLIDLATRNYLFIEEIPRGAFDRMDWRLRQRNESGDELLGYEREVLHAAFAHGGETLVSELADQARERLPRVQSLMYDDMVEQGWFAERPDAVRGRWATAGWALVAAGVVLTLVLAVAGTFGLVGLAVTLAGVALAGSAQLAPARTAEGSKVLGGLREFRSYLETADPSELPAGQREELISRLYAYALVFGLGDRWAAALAALDDDADPDDPLYWYGAPADWHLSDAAPSLVNLAATLNAAIGTRRLLAD